MSVFSYTATKLLSPGTVQGAGVVRDFRIVSFPQKVASKRKQNTSLGGAVESLLFRQEIIYACRTGLVEPRTLLEQQILEFFASVQNGEIFTFDRYGSIALPENPVNCILVSNAMSGAEVGKKFHQYGFTIREE